MKATLTFTLPEERYEHSRAVHASEAFGTLFDIDQHLRNVIKHGEGSYECVEDLAIHIRQMIGGVMQKVEE